MTYMTKMPTGAPPLGPALAPRRRPAAAATLGQRFAAGAVAQAPSIQKNHNHPERLGGQRGRGWGSDARPASGRLEATPFTSDSHQPLRFSRLCASVKDRASETKHIVDSCISKRITLLNRSIVMVQTEV